MEVKMKYKVIIKNILLAIVFLAILALLLSRIMYICREKSDNWRQDCFAQLSRDSVDNVLTGT